MKISLASALGTCFGVKDAINLALEPQFKGDLTIVGQLVHNRQVNESLKKNGVSVVDNADDLDQICRIGCVRCQLSSGDACPQYNQVHGR